MNVIIRRWFEERGIWRHPIAREIDRSSPTSETETSEANSDFNLETRLAGLSPEKLRAISVRAGLRALPLLVLSRRGPDNAEFTTACLAAFSGAAKAWYALRYPARPNETSLGPAAFPGGNYEDDRGILIAGTIVSATHPGVTPWGLTAGIYRIRTIAQSADGPASATVFDMAVLDDLQDLNNASASAVAGIPFGREVRRLIG